MAVPFDRLKEKTTRENLWLYILSILEKNEAYGYELRGDIERRFGFKPGNVTAYRVLYSLKRGGFVETVEREVGGRKRKYYEITEKGKQELRLGRDFLKTTLASL
ncbi:MAG: PadR family transcriptional regulator [Candidatus Altiarchaeota archaeon]|nr:PadR family transcriptional regulator [Candidatus Altiarchaeota archaeon]